MAREPKCRRVAFEPRVTCFFPDKKGNAPEYVSLKVEELEAIRLKDYLNLEQEDAAQLMNVSRPTFQRILTEAHSKVAEALTLGKGIRIEGGNYCLGSGYCRRRGRTLQASESCPHSIERRQTVLNKIAICASGDSPSSLIDERFGRCTFFMIWDPVAKVYQAFDNQSTEGAHGAGTGATQILLNQNVGTVITQRIGPKALAVLQQVGAKIYASESGDTVETTLQKHLKGELAELKEANN